MTRTEMHAARPAGNVPRVTTSPEDNAAPVPPSDDVRRAQERAETIATTRRAVRLHYLVPYGWGVLSIALVWFNVLYGENRWINGAIATAWVLIAVHIVTTVRASAYELGYMQGSALATFFASAGRVPPLTVPHYAHAGQVTAMIDELADAAREILRRERGGDA